MLPETTAEAEISEWLTNYGFKVACNRINKLNLPIFKTRGQDKGRPDLLIKNTSGSWYAIEVKPATTSKNVLAATKILRYNTAYLKEDTAYYVDGVKIKIRGFLVATIFSRYAHLFREETFEENEKWQIIPDRLPRFEGGKTKLFLRQLWEQYKQVRVKENHIATENTPEVGILTSTFTENKIDKPIIQGIGTWFYTKRKKWEYIQKLVKE